LPLHRNKLITELQNVHLNTFISYLSLRHILLMLSRACERSGAAKFSAYRSAPFMGLPLTALLRSIAGFKGGGRDQRPRPPQSPPHDDLPINRIFFISRMNLSINDNNMHCDYYTIKTL